MPKINGKKDMLFHTDFEIYKVRETQIPWFIGNLSSPQVVIRIRAEITVNTSSSGFTLLGSPHSGILIG